jgi:hydrophobic/amphiphilic exporter-1 (mainly G- bacteria), HAE1 family
MFSRFFIYRPIFASVISIVIVTLGLIAIPILPIEQTPDITPPTVDVTATYPGASAEVVAETVAFPIEQQVNGVEDMLYMSSKCTQDGQMTLTVTFDVGTDIDMATVLVQNRVAIAEPKLPEEAKRLGITTKKKSTSMVMMINTVSPDGRYDEIYQSNYVGTQIVDVLARVPGVGEVVVMGAKDFSMRIWLSPDLLKARELTTTDVVQAIREQNVQVAAGTIGAPPNPEDQMFQFTVNTMGRLTDVEQFEAMVLKVGPEGHLLRLKDVARVELGSESYNWNVSYNGKPSVALAVYQLPGANALGIKEAVVAEMTRLEKSFPPGLEYEIGYDTTKFVEASISEVIETLLIAVLLVILTVYIFLQDFRTTLVPAATIPVSLIGTLAVMLALGMSINTLTLFGLVLAIGIVVDDSIIVVENTMRIIDEEGLSAKDATSKAMAEITGPVVATTLVLLAVFVPTAMMSGITGRLYSQFAMTIATATVFSSINALTLSPALCGMLLRPTPSKRGWFFTLFNKAFDASTSVYAKVTGVLVRRAAISMVFFAGLMGATWFGFSTLPAGFLPDEDQGYFFAVATLPEGATIRRTEEALDKVEAIVTAQPGVKDVIRISGYSMLDGVIASSTGSLVVMTEPWDDRSTPELQMKGILAGIQPQLTQLQEAIAFVFPPPPIMGLGSAGGFEFQLQDRGGVGVNALETVANDLVIAGMQDPVLSRMNSNFSARTPQLYIDVDRVKAKRLDIPLENIFGTLQAYLGSAYVNDFSKFGRTFKVYAQADAQFRSRTEDIDKLEVRDKAGNMIPLSTLVTVSDTVGPKTLFRYNLYPSATITGQAAPGYASGDSIAAMQRLAEANVPPSMGYEWSGTTLQQLASQGQTSFIFGLAILMVFLFLAAQYESWGIPFAVLLSVPLALLGASAATWARFYDNNVYTQIGIVLLIGLSSKSAILIVEFAKVRREEGLSIIDAALESARMRFRAILMTAFSFILGVIPLVIATGAGSGSRRALGTAVFGGMVAATVLGVFFIPVLYRVVQGISEKLGGKKPA